MFGSIGGLEILVILVVGLLVLGPDHLPRAMRAAGKTLGELRRASTEFQRTINTELALEEEKKENTEKTPKVASETAPDARHANISSLPANKALLNGQKLKKKRPPCRFGINKKRKTVQTSPAGLFGTANGENSGQSPDEADNVDTVLKSIRTSPDFISAADISLTSTSNDKKKGTRRPYGKLKAALRKKTAAPRDRGTA